MVAELRDAVLAVIRSEGSHDPVQSCSELLACPSDDHAPLREDDASRGSRPRLHLLRQQASPSRTESRSCLLDDATPGPNGVGRRRRLSAHVRRSALLLDDAELLLRRDSQRLLWHLRHRRRAGPSSHRASTDEFGIDRLRGIGAPRALLQSRPTLRPRPRCGWSPG